MSANIPATPSESVSTSKHDGEAEIDPSAKPREKLYAEVFEYGFEIDGTEDVEDYRPGGFHPVDMFDVLDGRLEVIHKLGSGGYGVVWLCYEKDIGKWRAVKINAASRSHDDSPEIKALEMLGKDDAVSRSDSHIAMPLEIFWIEGPNGRHLCSVLPLLGPTLSKWRQLSLCTDATRINNVCYQLTKGLAFLHSRGICHGDLRPENALMRLKGNGLDDLKPEDLFPMLHYPEKAEVFTINGERSPHAPKFITEPLMWHQLKKYISDDVSIVDFGEAFEQSSPPAFLGIPRVYAAPEVLYGGFPPGIGSDIWALAYSIMLTRTGTSLGQSYSAPLWDMERFAGPIPPPFRQAAAEALYEDQMHQYERNDKWNKKPISPEEREKINGKALVKLTTNSTGDSCIRELELELGAELYDEVLKPSGKGYEWITHRLPEDEIKVLADLLSQLFKYQPDQRMRASEILKHAWFKGTPEVVSTADEKPVIIAPEEPSSAAWSSWNYLARLWEPIWTLLPTVTRPPISTPLLVSAIVIGVCTVLYRFFAAGVTYQAVQVVRIVLQE